MVIGTRGQATLAVLAVLPAVAQAGLRMPRFFSDDMILQRDEPVPVAGRADAGAEVTVALAGRTAPASSYPRRR